MGSRRAGVLLIALALVAGCGDDNEDENDGGGSTATTETAAASPAAQDAQAKADARELTTVLEACYADQQDYSACRRAEGWDDVGEARVESATATDYTIVSPSGSGNEFRLAKRADGSMTRECVEPGRAGCPSSGRW